MSDLTWHMQIVIKPNWHTTRPPRDGCNHMPPISGYGGSQIPLARPSIPTFQFQDGAGLRDPTNAELVETQREGVGVRYHAIKAACEYNYFFYMIY